MLPQRRRRIIVLVVAAVLIVVVCAAIVAIVVGIKKCGSLAAFLSGCSGASSSSSTPLPYGCVGGQCVPVAGGIYGSDSTCNNMCTPPPPPLPYGCVADTDGVSCQQVSGGTWGTDSTCGGFSCGTPPTCTDASSCPSGNACGAWNDNYGENPAVQNYCCDSPTTTTCGGSSMYPICTNQPDQNACLCDDNCASGICSGNVCVPVPPTALRYTYVNNSGVTFDNTQLYNFANGIVYNVTMTPPAVSNFAPSSNIVVYITPDSQWQAGNFIQAVGANNGSVSTTQLPSSLTSFTTITLGPGPDFQLLLS